MNSKTYTISHDGLSITCKKCGMTSYNYYDIAYLYCGNCHTFHKEYSRGTRLMNPSRPGKSFSEKLEDLIDDHLTFPGNPSAALGEAISALELKLMALKEQEKESENLDPT